MPSARFSASFPRPVSAAAVATTNCLAEGERLGVWRIGSALHACDSGRWYLARHGLAAREQVLVLVYQDPTEAAGVLLGLAELAGMHGQFVHPTLPMPLDSGLTAEGQAYVVLPHLDGMALFSASLELPLRQRLQLAVQLCEALREAHDQGVLLRELDPGLLWLAPGHQLRLMGLGLGELAPEPDAPAPRPGGAAAAFASPELLAGGQASLASETYALGMLACWLANGRPLRPDGSGTLLQSPTLLSGLSTSECLSLDALLRKALAESPGDRHASVRELAEDLRRWLAGDGQAAVDPGPLPSRPAALTAAEREAPVAPEAVAGRRAGWRSWLGLGAVLLGLLPQWGGPLGGPLQGDQAQQQPDTE